MLMGKTVPRYRLFSWTSVGGVLFFAAFTALTARIVIPLPFTPVPITLQVLAVILAGLILGPPAGGASQLTYLVAILGGVPLSAAGSGGLSAFLGPTGGYLVSFVPAAFVVGWLAQRAAGRSGRTVAALSGLAVIYILGTAWLAVWLGGDLSRAWLLGVAPFALIDLGKAVVAVAAAEGGRAFFAR
jgi:biotin transport system substrate-specific component